MEILKIDDKFSIGYIPNDNDRPVMVYRYGNDHVDLKVNSMMNFEVCVFYALLEARETIEALTNELREQTEWVD